LTISTGIFAYILIIFAHGHFYLPNGVFDAFQIVMTYGDHYLRPLSFALVFERTFATIRKRDYEIKAYWWISISSTILTVTLVNKEIKNV
jgi:hypothetical protein